MSQKVSQIIFQTILTITLFSFWAGFALTNLSKETLHMGVVIIIIIAGTSD